MCPVVLTLSHSGLKFSHRRKISGGGAAFHQVRSVARSLHIQRVVSDGQLEELVRLCLIDQVGAVAGVAAEAARLVACLRGRLRLAALLRAAPSA